LYRKIEVESFNKDRNKNRRIVLRAFSSITKGQAGNNIEKEKSVDET
jgi:hypothetical protein